MLQQRLRLSPAERREKGKLLLRDTAALCTLAGLAVALSFVTWGLFHSFSAHRRMLEQRWRSRGEAALAAHQPVLALDDLHSALAYAPDDRSIEVELATALADAGRLREARVYFTTLLEAEPGSGAVNLQMARLAIKENNAQDAVDHYQAAIDGTWNGDAFVERRQIRLELARFLIAQERFPEARNLLLITSGNGPDNFSLQLELGGLLEQARDPADALEIYRKAALHRATRLQALEGEGHAAAALGRFLQARGYLQEAAGEAAFSHQPPEVRDAVHAELEAADDALALYPSLTLPAAERARRIAHAAEQAQARLRGCASTPADAAPDSDPAAGASVVTLAQRLQQLNPLAPKPAPANNTQQSGLLSPEDSLAGLSARWASMPAGAALLKQLRGDPSFAQNTLGLAYATERAAAGCGPLAGDDAALLRIVQAPEQVEAQP